MPNVRGFIEQIEIGRAGLARIFLIHADGSKGTYVIEDLDADPERFNERLSKLGIARDAMNRAEPVEIEYVEAAAGLTVDRIVRITRDALGPGGQTDAASGLIVALLVSSTNAVATGGERHDVARVEIIAGDLQVLSLRLDLQAPERLVVQSQLEMMLDAHARGASLTFLFIKDTRDIIGLSLGDDGRNQAEKLAQNIDGFVESLSLIRLPGSVAVGNFAHVRFTTAPAFTGAGNTVGLSPFNPETINLLVPKNSLAYELFEAGLRDNLRMRVNAAKVGDKTGGQDAEPARPQTADTPPPPAAAGGSSLHATLVMSEAATTDAASEPGQPRPNTADHRPVSESSGAHEATIVMSASAPPAAKTAEFYLVFGAELLAHLASASRPVWITIERQSLDHGPDGPVCTKGVPSSDLTPQTLRDLRIPYPAVWRGLGCFNPGVYRFQFKLASDFKLLVDCKELCLYDSDVAGVKLAYACLEGDHVVAVEIEEWTCESEFIMDVYQIR